MMWFACNASIFCTYCSFILSKRTNWLSLSNNIYSKKYSIFHYVMMWSACINWWSTMAVVCNAKFSSIYFYLFKIYDFESQNCKFPIKSKFQINFQNLKISSLSTEILDRPLIALSLLSIWALFCRDILTTKSLLLISNRDLKLDCWTSNIYVILMGL